MDKIIVTVAGFAGIAFTYWFFLMKKEKEVAVTSKNYDRTDTVAKR